jgi:hypothetical protein
MPKRETKDIKFAKHSSTIKTDTGDITEVQDNYKIKIAQEPDYIKLYLNTLLTFKDLPKQMSSVLFQLLKLMGYADPECKFGGQLISLTAFQKKQIIERLGIQPNTLDQHISKLVKSGIIRRVGYGTYQANPNMFGRGEWLDIKAIKATFNFNTGTVEAEIKKTDGDNLSFLERAASGKIEINGDDDEDED